jgi:hypothetical protein
MSEETILLAVYKENADQARQHELFRQTITTLVAGVTGAVIGLSLKEADSIINSPLLTIAGSFLAIIGTYGLIACAKHYERNRMHVERLRELRHCLESLPEITPGLLTAINANADFRHNARYRHLHSLQLNKVWNTFHVLVIVLGVALAILPYRGGSAKPLSYGTGDAQNAKRRVIVTGPAPSCRR